MPAGHRRTAEHPAAADPLAADLPGSTRGYRRGCSWFASAIGLIPAMKGLFGRVRHFPVSAPGIEAVVDDEARQVSQRHVGGSDCGTIGGGPRQQLAGSL